MNATEPQNRAVSLGLVVLLAASISFAVIRFPGGLAIGSGLVVCLLLTSLTRFELTKLTLAFLVSQPLVQYLKRSIFLLGPQPSEVYYGVQAVSTLLFCLALAVALRRLSWAGMPRSGKLLAAYLALAVLTTLLAPGPASLSSRVVAVGYSILPIAAFYVGCALSLEGLLRVARVVVPLMVLSVAYGFLQLLLGPLPVEQAWAHEARELSLQASKAYDSMLAGPVSSGASPFRPFSFYSGPLMWGLFLVSTSVLLFVQRIHGRISATTLRAGVSCVAIGLVSTLSRSPVVAFLTMVLAYGLLALRSMRSPWLLLGAIAAGFALVIEGGSYLIAHYGGVPLPENALLARFLTVGTLEARISAWELLRQVAAANWLLGDGYAHSAFHAHHFGDIDLEAVMFAHNFVVGLVLYVGLPGLLLFGLFLFQWLCEATSALSEVDGRTERTVRWIIAFAVGLMAFGLFSGSIFMTAEFFLILGVLAGHVRSKAPRAVAQYAYPAGLRPRG